MSDNETDSDDEIESYNETESDNGRSSYDFVDFNYYDESYFENLIDTNANKTLGFDSAIGLNSDNIIYYIKSILNNVSEEEENKILSFKTIVFTIIYFERHISNINNKLFRNMRFINRILGVLKNYIDKRPYLGKIWVNRTIQEFHTVKAKRFGLNK